MMKKLKFNIGDVVTHRVNKGDKYPSEKYIVIGRGLLESEEVPQGEEFYLISGTRIDNSIIKTYVFGAEISKYNG